MNFTVLNFNTHVKSKLHIKSRETYQQQSYNKYYSLFTKLILKSNSTHAMQVVYPCTVSKTYSIKGT